MLEYSEAEVELSRMDDIARACKENGFDINQLKERYCCDLGYREVLHLSSVQCEIVNMYLTTHPAIALDKEAYALAFRAGNMLFNLYERLGVLEEGTRADQPEPERA